MKRLVVLLLFGIAMQSWAVPPMINYQGHLTDTGGSPLDTTVAITFQLYTDSLGGTPLWTETRPGVIVADGLFSVRLGQITALADSVFNRAQVWLGITVGNNTEMAPRSRVVSVGYSYRVGTVDGAAGGVINGKLNVGTGNTNTGTYAMVAGLNNHADGSYSVISGGGGTHPLEGNSAGNCSFIGGGRANIAGDHCVVSGGFNNTANNLYTSVGGGTDNTASGYYGATVAGGAWNEATGQSATVGGGHHGYARGAYSIVAGGGGFDLADSNSASGVGSTIGGGRGNFASGEYSLVAAGQYNTAGSFAATVGGGEYNNANGVYATVSGGTGNTASGFATVSGGFSNNAGGRGTVGGGEYNSASADGATVAGGSTNTASGENATVGGGKENIANTNGATVSGGRFNRARGWFSTTGGGGGTTAADSNSAIGAYSTVPGGNANVANGDYSFAAGRRAKANSFGSFVWGDATDSDITASANNQWIARASGGVYFYTNPALTSGMYLGAGGSSWNSVSDSTKKRNIRLVDTKRVLDKVSQLPIKQWSYKSQDSSIEHIGPMAQDFWAAFRVGDDSLAISTIDPAGIALAAIQELAKQVNELREENRVLHTQIQTLLAKDQQGNLYKEK